MIVSGFMGSPGLFAATSTGDISKVGGTPSVDLPDCVPRRQT
jgi:hypothetical protein